MRYKVLVTPRSFGEGSDEPIRIMEDAGCEVIRMKPQGRLLQEEELASLVGECDGMIVGLDPVSKKVITSGKRLKVISKYGVGLDNVDLEAAKARGIIVTYTPGANTEAVADLAFGLMLACARNIPLADRKVRSGQWQKITGSSVWGKTLGVIGTGRIGRAVVRRASGFDMRILCHDEQEDPALISAYHVEYVQLDELLRQSDYVTLHIPLTERTQNFIGAAELSIMKKTAYLINTARGELVDEEALYQALISGKIAGAGLDVFQQEPPTGSKILGLENVVLAPHMGAHTAESIINMSIMASRNLVAALRGERPEATVVS